MRTKIGISFICIAFAALVACAPNTHDIQNGYEWGSLSKIGLDDSIYCNRPENVNGLDNLLLLCHDPIYDILYFVNYGEDYFIYAYKDGRTEKVVDIPARRLFCRDGMLYFMVESYDDRGSLNGVEYGNIMQYNPLTGQVSTVIEEQAESMTVYQDGIYYTKEEKEKFGEDSSIVDRVIKKYSFSDKSIAECSKISGTNRTLYRCGNNFLFYILEPYQGDDKELLSLAGGREITIATGMKMGDIDLKEEKVLNNLLVLNNFFVNEKEIYYINNMDNFSEFVIYNIESQTDTRYPLSSMEQDAYIVADGSVYFSDFKRLDLQTGREELFSSDVNYQILEWYTDGVNLYGLCRTQQEENAVVQLCKVIFKDKKAEFIPLKGENNEK